MPIETAQYIDTLQPDWPLGTDPESGGDDHLRMIKQVLKNQFPNLNAPVTGTPTQLNNLTSGMVYYAEGVSGNPVAAHWAVEQADNPGDMAVVQHSTPSLSDLKLSNGPQLSVTWGIIMNILYPVHKVIITDNNVNPATTLGFGTWVAVSGAIYGVGAVADATGMSVSWNAGNTGGSYRIQEKHLVSMTKTLSMDKVDDHTHSETHVAPSSTPTVYARTDALSSGYATVQTGPAGGHTPSGEVTIGSGTTTSGEIFATPGYGLYFWRRTA